MAEEEAPLSLGSQIELDELKAQIAASPKYALIRAARVIAMVLSGLVLIGMLADLGMFASSRESAAIMDKLTAFGLLAIVIGALAKAFFLMVSAQIFQLWLEVVAAVRLLAREE